ncbi:LPS export ABC transporter protein LptC [Desulfacinum hydrothermale DSM 13146]|uniref:LPS export ABC transporter protein LptC n=1 Tax=Desulfacinum hydrothermale DSM 13146 TaxID=1121390 RepID=A0A1W1XRN1_9BACT|nr:LPS export ABC transporter periplasmic protein LptC [Desulfacinum hydrothermale]SMC26629.1 LPS export ABC transporter protein LptC [Desulfacinum hydrothermale DSM 13146]
MVQSRPPTLWLLVAAAAVLAGVFIYAAAHKSGSDAQKEQPAPVVPDSEMRLTQMEYTEVQEGRQVWRLKAREAKYFQESQKTHLQDVHVEIYLEDGRTVVLESREGMLYAGTKDIELWGHVKAQVPQGYVVLTERARYRHADRQIVSETPVRVVGPLVQLQGSRWRYDAPAQRAFVDGRVRAVVKAAR